MSFWFTSKENPIISNPNPSATLPNIDKQYTYPQKFTLLKWNLTASLFLIFSPLIQIALFYSGSWELGFGQYYLLTVIALSLLYGSISFLSSIYLFRHKFHEIKQFYSFLNLKLIAFLFIFSALLIIIKILMILVIFLGFRYFGSPTVERWALFFLLIDLAFLFYSLFFNFCVEGSKSTCRILLYISGLALITLSFFLNYGAEKVRLVYSLEFELDLLVINYTFKGLARISIIFIIATELVFFFSLRKFKIFMIVGANSTLLLTALMCLINGFLIQNLHGIDQFFTIPDNCVSALKYLNSDYLTQVECSNKYLEISNSPYLNCSDDEQSLIWEQPFNWTKNACIDTLCCENPLALVYFSDIMMVYLFSMGIIGLGFIIMACSYYLGNVYESLDGEYKIPLYLNKLMVFLYIAIPIIGIFALFYLPKNLPDKKPFFPKDFTTNSDKLISYSSDATDYIPSCFLLSEFLSSEFTVKLSISKCHNLININDLEACIDDIRVVLIIENAQIYIPLDYNSEKIFSFDQRSKLLIFTQSSSKYIFDYIAFQGSVSAAKEFIEEIIQICPESLFKSIKYTYTTYQIAETEFQIDNQTNDNSMESSNNTILMSHLNKKHKASVNKRHLSSDGDGISYNITILDFNLTDNVSFAIIGAILGSFNSPLENCTVCFTEGNPELGDSYECLIETNSGSDGVFTLGLKQLVNNIPFVGFLQFIKPGFFPLQMELLLTNNKENLVNLGYVQMNPMNSSGNTTSSTTTIKNSLSYNWTADQDAIEELQEELNDVSFGILELEIFDMLSLAALDQVIYNFI